MAIVTGTRLGPYEILAPIGAGGMGEVYRARDTNLKRDVALKVLPEAFTHDSGRMLRFQREAEVLASLNHPNIATVHGVEEHALVMELVEGESPKGPMPFEEAWKIALQIADALEYAHERGIVHRDLKPANIKVTPEGVVKLLDFGLAKAFSDTPDSPGSDPSNSPTVTLGATVAGTLLGTASYMAPEQAKGKRVDKRADIWSWGVVLYELLTGDRLFKGDDTADTLAQVLTKEPDLEPVPAQVRKLLRRCLEKNPKQRLRDIGDAPGLLEDRQEVPPPSHSRLLPWMVAAVLTLALVVVGFLYFHERVAEPPVLRFFVAPPEKTILLQPAAETGPPVLSPDGQKLAYVATQEDGPRQIWLQSLDALSARPLIGTNNAGYPFWSPDNKWLGFFADGKLKKIDVSGGPTLTVCDIDGLGRGGTWSQDGVIVFSPGVFTPLYRVAASGGAATPVTSLDTSKLEASHRSPWFLPDGHHFLYTTRTGTRGDGWIRIASLDSTSDNRTLVALPLPSNAVYANGYLLFTNNESTLMAQPFDVKRLTVTAEAIPLVEHVQYNSRASVAMFSTSAIGVLAYETGGREQYSKLTWFDREGKPLSSSSNLPNLSQFRLSPDGNSAAVVLTQGQNPNVWIWDFQRGLPTRFTFDPATGIAPVWSPDGRSIVFASLRKGHSDLYRKPTDQTGIEELIYDDSLEKIPTSWSSDGKFLLYMASPASRASINTGNAIWVLPMIGERKPFPFVEATRNASNGHFSPNGRWVAYESNDSGQFESYIAAFAGKGARRQVSANGGFSPVWRHDGREIFYLRSGSSQLMAADVRENGAALEIGAVHALFGPIRAVGQSYDVSPDGKQILTATDTEPNATEHLTVVQNWTKGLKR
jgi:Tol biopolymer transport system component